MIDLHCLLRLIKTLPSALRDHSPPFPASTWTRSSILFRLFSSSLGQAPKQTSQNNKTRTIWRTLTTIQTSCVLLTILKLQLHSWGGGREGVLFPTRYIYICKKWKSSQQMGNIQSRLEWGISRHAHARKKLTVVSRGLWVECRMANVPYKKSPIWRRTLPSSGIIGIPLNPYLHLETIIYHKENENNSLKCWPTRLVE